MLDLPDVILTGLDVCSLNAYLQIASVDFQIGVSLSISTDHYVMFSDIVNFLLLNVNSFNSLMLELNNYDINCYN